MALIICPTLDELVEFDMLSSKVLMKANQRIKSITVRNHTTKGTGSKKGKNHKLPLTISNHNKLKMFSINTHSQKVVRMTVTDVEETNGIEIFQDYLAKCDDTKDLNFYVMKLVLQETCGDKHITSWKRGNVHKDVKGMSATHVLSLTQIDGKDAIKNFTQDEMRRITARITNHTCKIEEVPAIRRLRICT